METVGNKIQLRSKDVIAKQSVTPSSLIDSPGAGGVSFLMLWPQAGSRCVNVLFLARSG